MTIDEAIKHYEELAEVNEDIADNCDMDNWMNKAGCEERASDYRQLAEWLTELKELRNSVGTVKPLIVIEKLIQARLRGVQKIKLEALQSSDRNTAYIMLGAENVCNAILADLGAITGNKIKNSGDANGNYISKDELMQYLEPLTNTPAIVIKRYVENMPAVDIQNSQELIYKKACGVAVEASIEAQKSWEQWHDNVKAIQESNLLETEVEGLYLNFEQDGEQNDN